MNKNTVITILCMVALFVWQNKQNEQIQYKIAQIEQQPQIVVVQPEQSTQPQTIVVQPEQSTQPQTIVVQPEQSTQPQTIVVQPEQSTQPQTIVVQPEQSTQPQTIVVQPEQQPPMQPQRLPDFSAQPPPVQASGGEIGTQETTSASIWLDVKQVLVDLNVWSTMQSVMGMIIVISIVFIILSYLKK